MPASSPWSVSRFVAHVRDILATEPDFQDLWLEGEVTNYTRSSAGHQYFSLKDSESTVNCVLFRRAWRSVVIANGDQVALQGSVDYYAPRGQLQIICNVVVPQGLGELQLRFEALRARLEEEGLFVPDRKRALPAFPRRIGVVTSPTGAVLQDIRTCLERRYPLAELILAPTAVQGPEAVRGVLRGLRDLQAEGVDVIIVARGGGSLEELQAFNEEPVARAIFASSIPVISAIGHETDVTIADLVADLRAPTPTAAAELAAPDRADLRRRTAHVLATAEARLTSQLRQLHHETGRQEVQLRQHLPPFHDLRRRTDDAVATLQRQVGWQVEGLRKATESQSAMLQRLDPLATLARGYAIVTDTTTGDVITTTAAGRRARTVSIAVQDGEFQAGGNGSTTPSRQGRGGRSPSLFQGTLDGLDPREQRSA